MTILQMSEKWRARMFHAGVLLAGLTAIATLLTWVAPVPLLRVNDGWADVNLYSAFAALPMALMAAVLGSYGRGLAKVIVVSSGVLLFVLAWLGMLSHGH